MIEQHISKRRGPVVLLVDYQVSDKTLIGRIAERDQDALQTLASRYRPRVIKFVQRHVRDRHDVEDLVNDVFVAVWQHAERYEGRSAVMTWILGIARHKFLDFKSRVVLPTQPLTDALIDTLVDSGMGPEDEVTQSEVPVALRRCLCAWCQD